MYSTLPNNLAFEEIYKSGKVLYELGPDNSPFFNSTVEPNKCFMFFSNTSDVNASITINGNITIKFDKNDTAPKSFGFPFELKSIDDWSIGSLGVTGKLIIIGFN